jgi:ABC-type nitrate/sulfonate/bicarbonate transport system substrate-binding protein
LLRKHGLIPERDVQFVQAGETATIFASLKAGRVDAAVLSPPFTWYAEELGFLRLGTQAKDMASAWPRNLLIAREKFLAGFSRTISAFLRAHVRAIRLARENPEIAVQTIMKRLKYERRYAERAYMEVLPGFDERGRLPAEAMHAFWEMAVASGEVTEPWPESRYLDRRFIDTFEEWAPR